MAEAASNEDFDAAGRVKLTANFQNDSISGEMYDFISAADGRDPEEKLDGTLTVKATYDRDADIDIDYGITGTVTGQLSKSEDTAVFNGDLLADFLGESGKFIAGEAFGDVEITEDGEKTPLAFVGGFLAD